MRLKYLVSTYLLLGMSIGVANADTITFSGTTGVGIDQSQCIALDCGLNSPLIWPSEPLSGTIDYTGNVVNAVNITVFPHIGPPSLSLSQTGSVIDFGGSEWGFSPPENYTIGLAFDLSTGLFTGDHSLAQQLGRTFIAADFPNVSGTFTVTPLPTALPLFVTGLLMFAVTRRLRRKP